MAASNGFAIQEFSIQTPMTCLKPDGETWVLTCRVVLSDAKRDAHHAADLASIGLLVASSAK